MPGRLRTATGNDGAVMSESPQTAEIEDVLSSIRRLVAGSEGAARTRTNAAPDASLAEDGISSPTALVLTDADRVDPSSDPAMPDSVAAQPPAAPVDQAPDAGAEAAPTHQEPGSSAAARAPVAAQAGSD